MVPEIGFRGTLRNNQLIKYVGRRDFFSHFFCQNFSEIRVSDPSLDTTYIYLPHALVL